MHSQTQRVRFVTWTFIVLCIAAGTGLYFWSQEKYETKAGVVTSSPAIADNTLTTGLVGYWTFDRAHVTWADTTTEIKDTAGTNHGNALGSLAAGSLALGKQGQALTFNGTSDYVSALALNVTSFSVSLWFKPLVASGSSDISSLVKNKDRQFEIRWDSTAGNEETFGITSGGGTYYGVDIGTVTTNAWSHIVGTWDGTTMRAYNNGALSGSLNPGVLPDTGGANIFEIGRNDNWSGYANGVLDDVRVYSRALSATEVSQLYTSGNATVNAPVEDPLSQSLLGYWKMDEGTGTSTTADASGNATTLTMTVMESGDWVTGQIGPYSLDFDGTAEYLTVADPAILDFADGASFTLTGWFNRDLAADDDTIIAKKTNQTTNVGYTVWIDNNASTDYLFFEASDGTDTYQIQSTTDFSTTGWHHFAISWNDNSSLTTPVNLYIDGALNNGATSGTFANVGDLSASNTNAFRIGAESGTADNFFDGKLDDIRVYGYPLSAGDVLKLYQTTAPAQPVDTGLVGHWTFDGPDIQGTTVIDRSGKGNNGTATGTTKTIGKLGQGLSFNGTSDALVLPNFTLTASSKYTWSAWVKPSANNTAGFWSFTNDNGTFLIIYAETGVGTNLIDANWKTPGVSLETLSSSNVIANNQFFLVTVTYDGSLALANRFVIYANGVNVTSGSIVDGTIGNVSSTDTRIGSDGNFSTFFPGVIDDARFYNRALSATEVADLYNMGK